MKKPLTLGAGGWGFRQQTLEQQLRFTREAGLATIEFSIGEAPVSTLPVDTTDAAVAQVRAAYRQHGVPLTHVFTGNDFTRPVERENRAGVERMRRIIGLTAALGARYLRIFAGFSPVAEVTGRRWDVMIDCLSQCAEIARAAGIVLAIETHGGVKPAPGGVIHFHSVSTEPSALLRLCAELPASIALNFDPANLRAAGVQWPDRLVPQLAPRIQYLHLKDFALVDPAQNIVRPVGCGEGMLDWPPLMRSLSFYQGVAMIEYEPTEDIEDGTLHSARFLAPFLK